MAKAGVIGLDIGATNVRAAEIVPGSKGNPATLLRYAEAPLPLGAVRDGEVEDPQTVSMVIRQLWSAGGFSTKDVNMGVGNQRVVVRELDLPWLPIAQLRQSLPFHVSELLPMSTDEALLDFLPTAEFDGPQGRMVHGMLVAATRDTVRANVLAVESAGLRPQLVDLNTLALLRALKQPDSGGRTIATVEIGAQISQVVIARDGSPRFVRILPFGGHHATDAVARAMNVSFHEADGIKRSVGLDAAVSQDLRLASEAVAEVVRPLIDSIRNTFVYYAGNNPGAGIDLVVLTGGGAMLNGLGQALSSASRLPVTLGDPAATLRRGKYTQNLQVPMAAVPLGLAQAVAA